MHHPHNLMRALWTLPALLLAFGCTRSALPATTCLPDRCSDGGTLPDLGAGDAGSAACVDRDVETRSCGSCGTQSRECMGGVWQPFGACTGEGECAASTTDTMSCGSSVGACKPGTQTRTCSATCSWGAWSSCGGYVGPSPETCGDNVDNNCNGVTDEGCSCSPVDVGHGSSFALPGNIVKMVNDPKRCFLYALEAGAPPRLLVLDTGNKNLLTAIDLPGAADLDVSPNGQYLVVSQPSLPTISVIDKGLWTVASTVAVAKAPQRIEVSDSGLVYYVTDATWAETHRVDLTVGGDTKIGEFTENMPDVELSADGNTLYVGDAGLSSGNVTRYDIASGMEVKVDAGGWDHGFGFPSPDRWTFLSPNGQHLYYANFQLDAHNLPLVTGATGSGPGAIDGRVFAEDVAGTFAVTESGVFDAQLVMRVATFPVTPIAAALTAGDGELWYLYGGRAYYQNVGDFLAGVPLGVRARPPAPLSSYSISRLVADPVRPRVYGLDRAHQRVVAIDTTSGLATGAIIVGSQPSDLTVSASGSTLWVAHEAMLALGKIDLASWQLSGFVQVPIDSWDVEAIGDAWVAAIDFDQWTSPTLVDATTGAVTDSKYGIVYAGALAAAADGKSLFVGESGITGGNVFRYDVSSGKLVQTARSSYDNGYGFPDPARAIQSAADGSFVFYAGYSIEGTGLATLNYLQPDTILTVTHDGRLAISATKVYRASDGMLLGTLPVAGTSQAATPDGKSLYVVAGGALHTIDLTQY
jgi:DNA-binding beta-propeller fold protein YncE